MTAGDLHAGAQSTRAVVAESTWPNDGGGDATDDVRRRAIRSRFAPDDHPLDRRLGRVDLADDLEPGGLERRQQTRVADAGRDPLVGRADGVGLEGGGAMLACVRDGGVEEMRR